MGEASKVSSGHGSRWRLQVWLGIEPSVKPKVYSQVFAAARIDRLSYWLEIFFSAGIATFGLVESSPAVIIGAMLVSPLMGPIMGAGLALAIGDLYLGVLSVLNLAVSVAVSVAFSGFLVWLLPFHSVTAEILSRTNPNLLDLGIALFSGLAGSVVVSRGSGSEGVTALPGVAIAVALMPPLCTVGFGLGSGLDLEIMGGAGLLFVTNLVAIVACAFLVFLLVGLNASEVQEAMGEARSLVGAGVVARFLAHLPTERLESVGVRLRWRVVMIACLLGAIAVPLRSGLLQVTRETLAREAIQAEVKKLEPPEALVSEQVQVTKDAIVIRLFSSKPVPEARIALARQALIAKTGEEVQLSVETVASTQELSDVLQHMQHPAAVVEKPKPLAEVETEVRDRVRPALETAWPTAAVPIRAFDVALGDPAGLTVEVRYEATKDLGEIPQQMILKSLQSQLGMPELALKTQRVPPEKPGGAGTGSARRK